MKVSEIKIGETYNGITIEGESRAKNGERIYVCRCGECGRLFTIRPYKVGRSKHCLDCENKSRIFDLTGRKFGHLTVLAYVGKKKGRSVWKCKCDCGNECEQYGSYLKRPFPSNPANISCGCVMRANNITRMTKHGKFGNREVGYTCWQAMKDRCLNPNVHNYCDYGGRGIKVCDRWLGEHGFENFLADMGERPSKDHSIDRIDVNGDYTPENCRWATHKEQMNNRRNTTFVVIENNEMPLTRFCEKYHLNHGSLSCRLKRGLDINSIILNLDRFRETKSLMRRDGHYNHNRVVSDEVMKLLESKLTNQNN